MIWWSALYLSVFSGAILAGSLTSILELHLFYSLLLVAFAFTVWWYWHQNWGEIITPNREYGLKIGILGVIILGWLIGVRG
jgi:hypothetical protein